MKQETMSTNDLNYQTATELVAALANKQISSVELTESFITRIEQHDNRINAVVVRDFAQARAAAKAADAAIAKGVRLPLLGLPITVKESFNVSGLPTTRGNPRFKNWIPNDDAFAITRLKAAGAIIMGKTNVPLMLQDWQTYNEIYGATNNPWDLKLTPGGSSGGSSAALAAGFTSLELGSDFAGSIRVPAHYCGVFGHRPSVHLIPLRGTSSPPSPPSPYPKSDLMVVGPMARSATDLALALNLLAGPDEMWDGKAYKLSLPPARHKDIKSFRVLIINSHPLCPISTIITQSIDRLAENLSKLGVTVSQNNVAFPGLAQITQTFVTLFSAFIAANVPIEEYNRQIISAKTLDANDASIAACYLRGYALNHREWEQMISTRNQLRQQWRNLYKDFDVVICPIMPTPAFPHDHSDPNKRQIEIDGKLFPYENQYAWPSIASLFGLPATAVPIAHAENGLPIGVQVIGDYLEDYTTIEFANLLEHEFGGFSKPIM